MRDAGAGAPQTQACAGRVAADEDRDRLLLGAPPAPPTAPADHFTGLNLYWLPKYDLPGVHYEKFSALGAAEREKKELVTVRVRACERGPCVRVGVCTSLFKTSGKLS